MRTAADEPTTPGGQRLARWQIRLYALGFGVLAAGSAASVWVYRHASRDELADALTAAAYNTKKAQDELERYGGKANILATDLEQWFAGLWHGRHLAYTLAALTLAAALAIFYTALFLPDLPPLGEKTPEGSGPGR